MKRLLGLLIPAFVVTGAAAGDPVAEIDYWTQGYDGRELAAPMDRCLQPTIPEISRTNRDIKKVVASFTRWNECYQRVVKDLDPSRHPVTHVPSAVLNEMNDDQYQAAARHMDEVYARAVRAIGARADPVVQRFTQWRTRTEAFVTQAEIEREVDLKYYLYRRGH
ncbi:hypothetical protein E4L96_00760 [Massilia arenosa]|uniref:Uncharacterized protein n=1 Tax=Zemynaea arenosa TaxID=2561931 RepID=A0A4Y9STA8_9BURK|nr:hypothetical protein [Massilia arenosa]TFW30022.1 hypothetical protein E4L96_00760 [Massilia arenosa]